jgi:hypothetical protein
MNGTYQLLDCIEGVILLEDNTDSVNKNTEH